jgi:hypothetical protein
LFLANKNAVASSVSTGFSNNNAEGPNLKNNILFNGRVMNNNNQPVSNALVRINRSEDSVTTNVDGSFTFHSNDSLARVSITSAGNKTLDTVIKSSMANTIALSEAPSWLSTIPVTKMNRRIKPPGLNKNRDSSSRPAGGWESFQQYVHDRLHQKLDTLLRLVGT